MLIPLSFYLCLGVLGELVCNHSLTPPPKQCLSNFTNGRGCDVSSMDVSWPYKLFNLSVISSWFNCTYALLKPFLWNTSDWSQQTRTIWYKNASVIQLSMKLDRSSTTPYQLNQNKLRFIRLGIHTSGVEEQNPGLRSVDDDDLVVEASHCGQNRVRRWFLSISLSLPQLGSGERARGRKERDASSLSRCSPWESRWNQASAMWTEIAVNLIGKRRKRRSHRRRYCHCLLL